MGKSIDFGNLVFPSNYGTYGTFLRSSNRFWWEVMTAFITPQPDHQPLHIGAPDQHTRLLDKKPTNSCSADSILKAGATLNQWEVAPSGLGLTGLLLRMETEQTANTNTNQSLTRWIKRNPWLVIWWECCRTSKPPVQGCMDCKGTFHLFPVARFSYQHCLPRLPHYLRGWADAPRRKVAIHCWLWQKDWLPGSALGSTSPVLLLWPHSLPLAVRPMSGKMLSFCLQQSSCLVIFPSSDGPGFTFIPRPTKLTSTYVRGAAWRNLRVRLLLRLV